MKEFFLALLLVSGPLKAHLNLMGLPIPDITLVAALLCTATLMLSLWANNFKLHLNKTSLSFLSVLGAFAFLTAVSGFWSLSPSFWMIKWALFLLPLLACLYPLLLANFRLEKFYRSFVLMSFFTCLFFAYYFPQWRLGLLEKQGLDVESYKTIYLGIGGMAGMNLLVLFGRPTIFTFPFRFFFYLFFTAILFLASARGAVIFTFVCGFLLMGYRFIGLLTTKRIKKESLYAPTLLALLFIGALFVKDGFSDNIFKLAEHSLTRLSLLFADNKGASISSRFEHIETASQGINENPILGLGMASYGIFRIGEDTLDHPHNIFLEAWFEQGILGLVLLSVILMLALSVVLKNNRFELVSCILFQIGVSLTSFSYSENRIMFAFLGLAIASSLVPKKNGNSNNHATKPAIS